MKTVAITGPPGSGKTTLWTAIGGGGTTGDVATISVPDPRLDELFRLHQSKKRSPAHLEVADIHALARTHASATAKLREADAIVIVVAAFGGLDSSKTVDSFLEDFILADLGPIENRIERAGKDANSRKELPALERARDWLGGGGLLLDLDLEKSELDVLASIAPITLKPMMVVFNVDEEAPEITSDKLPHMLVNAALEAEVAGMTLDEAEQLLGAYGIDEPVSKKIVFEAYSLFDLITFFTVGPKESRAWEVRRGSTAPEAAGQVHSDMQRGFIRAEVATFGQIVESGSWDRAKSQGKLRVEGRDYVVADGDVIVFRFSV